MSKKGERMKEALRETAAEFLAREAGPQSLITVTAADINEDNKRGIIFITVLPETTENAALQFANRNRREFADFFKKRVRGMQLGHVEFVIDKGEKMRQRLDEIGN